jgi:hypothetical protein
MENIRLRADSDDDDLQLVSAKVSVSQPLPTMKTVTPKPSSSSSRITGTHRNGDLTAKSGEKRPQRAELKASDSVEEYLKVGGEGQKTAKWATAPSDFFQFRKLLSGSILDRLHADTCLLASQLYPTVKLPPITEAEKGTSPTTLDGKNNGDPAPNASASPEELIQLLDEFDCTGNLLIANLLSKLRCVLNRAK